jgi:hypothetical protein
MGDEEAGRDANRGVGDEVSKFDDEELVAWKSL